MRVFTYSEARQKLSELLDIARREEVLITRRGGESYSVSFKSEPTSPFDVPGIDTKVSAKQILQAIRDSRKR